MTETLFEFDERNYLQCQNAYRGARNQEYYLGDYSIEGGSTIDVRAERESIGASSIINLKSSTRLFFRRTWAHIRQDPTDVTVLWFVRRGRLCVSHQSGYTIAAAGDCVTTKSLTPFFIECQPGEEGVHEVLHVIVPTHLVRRYVAAEVATGFTIPGSQREAALAEDILTYLFENAGVFSEEAAGRLLESVIALFSGSMQAGDRAGAGPRTISDRRLGEVLRYIENHLSDPGLSVAKVAEGCGISPRYTSYLLKLHGTPFSSYVWEQRLKLAAQWIEAARDEDLSISEIAYRVGFKSPAHFSRMFKRVYKVSPSRYRANCASGADRERGTSFAGGAKLLQ